MKEEKKVGLVAVLNHNYGSQLQAYAMQRILDSLGINNEIIKYKEKSIKQLRRIKNPAFLYMKGKSFIKNSICRICYPQIYSGIKVRSKVFERYKNENCRYSPYISSRKNLIQYSKNYDLLLVGSDQVWHPANLEMDYFTLGFSADDVPKIAYAPSFGVSAIPKDQIEKTRNYLDRFSAISVREDAGAKIVHNLIGEKVPVVCDPTALLTGKDWSLLKSDRVFTHKSYIFCYFLGKNSRHRDIANEIKKCTGYDIIALQHLDEFVKEDLKFADICPYDVNPFEFISLIADSEYVLTDSFHGTMFSIYFHKKFVTFPRYERDSKDSTNSRIISILRELGLEQRYIESEVKADTILSMEENWEEVDRRLNTFRKNSLNYLMESLEKFGGIKFVNEKKNVAEKLKRDCTGCTACYNICPKRAIIMKRDQEGFLYPNIDMGLCIECGLCLKKCPTENIKRNKENTRTFLAQNTNLEIRKNSSSGGVFSAIAEKMIASGGYVAGANFDADMRLVHIITDIRDDIKSLRASKYIQSELGDVFARIREILECGKPVLFCGTPCQVAGLKLFLGKKYNQLLLVDVVCYGVPSPGIFGEFITFLQKKHKSRVDFFYFRDKSYGYASPNVKAVFKNGEIEEMTSDIKSYTRLFFRGIITRVSCFECKFKTVEKASDLTLGDFWNIKEVDKQLDDDLGTTLVFAHTDKGMEYLKSLLGITLKEIKQKEALQQSGPMLLKSSKADLNRANFFKEKMNYINKANKYAPETLKNRAANIIKPFLLKTGLIKLGILKSVKKAKIKTESKEENTYS